MANLMGAWKLRDGGAEQDVMEGLLANDSGQDSFKKDIVDSQARGQSLVQGHVFGVALSGCDTSDRC